MDSNQVPQGQDDQELNKVTDAAVNQPAEESKTSENQSGAGVLEHVDAEEAAHLETIAEHHEEIEAEPVEDFGQMTKEDLAVRMEAFSKENDVNSVKNRVNAAREALQTIFNHEKDAAFAAFIEAGGVKEEFDYKDPLESANR